MVTCHGFVRRAAAPAGTSTLLDTFSAALKLSGFEGQWLQPSLTSPAGNWTVNATWTFLPKDRGDYMRVNIARYGTELAVDSAFERQARILPSFVPHHLPEIGASGYSDEMSGSIWVIYNSSLLYMATIESQHRKAQLMEGTATTLGQILNASMEHRSNIKCIESASMHSSMPVSVGLEFSVKVEVSHPTVMEGCL
jgi:hypothetical protein